MPRNSSSSGTASGVSSPANARSPGMAAAAHNKVLSVVLRYFPASRRIRLEFRRFEKQGFTQNDSPVGFRYPDRIVSDNCIAPDGIVKLILQRRRRDSASEFPCSVKRDELACRFEIAGDSCSPFRLQGNQVGSEYQGKASPFSRFTLLRTSCPLR